MRRSNRQKRLAKVPVDRGESNRKTLRNKQIRSGLGARAKSNIMSPPPLAGEFTKRVKVGRLRTVANWRREISRVYRQMRRGEIPPELGTKLAFVARLGLDAATNEEEVEQLKALNARYEALISGTPAAQLPALEHDQGDAT